MLAQTPSVKKILVKVVHSGSPLKSDGRTAWLRAATISAIAQSGGKVSDFSKSCLAIDPMKPGYGWIIIPIRAALFKALEGVCSALNLKSGTLVLFRFWREVSCPMQWVYAFSLHLIDDNVPHDVAVTDYKDQNGEGPGQGRCKDPRDGSGTLWQCRHLLHGDHPWLHRRHHPIPHQSSETLETVLDWTW